MRWIKKSVLFIAIGLISGTILLIFLKFMKIITGSRSYDLLFDVSYIPVLKKLQPVWLTELLFHYITSIAGIVVLYYLLAVIGWKFSVTAFSLAIVVTSAVLFCLTLFSDKTPPLSDIRSWIFWVIGHGLFALVAGILIRNGIAEKKL